MDLVRVALDLPLAEPFDYLPPRGRSAAALAPGVRVRVPFRGTTRIGIVVDVVSARGRTSRRDLKSIIDVLDTASVFGDSLFATLLQAAAYYLHPIGEVLFAALPPEGSDEAPRRIIDDPVLRRIDDQTLVVALKPDTAPMRLYEALAGGPKRWRRLLSGGGFDLRARKRLESLGLIETIDLSVSARQVQVKPPDANAAQQAALDAVLQARDRYACFVLEGVTGSGKTEVYVRAIESVLAAGRQALLMVPEIGLTPQVVGRFRERLVCPVLVSHSGLSDRERGVAFTRCRAPEPLVLIGTRSAGFAPFSDLGIVIIDEEHDASFKQQEGFRYHARDVALMRAHRAGIPVVLGSATPSFETLNNLALERYRHLRLPQRAQAAARAPRVELVDLGSTPTEHGLARTSIEAIRHALERGEQAMVFRNRRGFAPSLACELCGYRPNCERCDRPLTWHKGESRLKCHYCQQVQRDINACPNDFSPLRPIGHGTERIEEGLLELFPGIPILRFDRDTIGSGADFEDTMQRAIDGGPVILVGTQMLAKGHDLPTLTVVVLVDADHALLSSDTRASERAAQQLVQVAGRAGRAQFPGQVFVQTRHAGHAFFQTLLKRGYRGFAEQELILRMNLDLPPFSAQALLRADSPDEAHVLAFLEAASALLPEDSNQRGPIPAPHAKRANRFRMQLWLQFPDRKSRAEVLRPWLVQIAQLQEMSRVRWSIDVDPVNDD